MEGCGGHDGAGGWPDAGGTGAGRVDTVLVRGLRLARTDERGQPLEARQQVLGVLQRMGRLEQAGRRLRRGQGSRTQFRRRLTG